MYSQELQEKVIHMIGNSKTEEVLTTLEAFLKGRDKDLHLQIVMFKSELTRAENQYRLGYGNFETVNKVIARINYAILDDILEKVLDLARKEENKDEAVVLKVCVAIVKYHSYFLLTERKAKEGNLTWAFPAGMIKPGKTEQDVLVKECFEETNIHIKPVLKLGERLHPDTKVKISYWICDYISGEIENKDKIELAEVKWVTSQEALNLITSDIFPPLKDYLINSQTI